MGYLNSGRRGLGDSSWGEPGEQSRADQQTEQMRSTGNQRRLDQFKLEGRAEQSRSTDSADEIDRNPDENTSVRDRRQSRTDQQTEQMRSTGTQRRSHQFEIEGIGEQIDKAVRISKLARFCLSSEA
jgi:hypothetical protein